MPEPGSARWLNRFGTPISLGNSAGGLDQRAMRTATRSSLRFKYNVTGRRVATTLGASVIKCCYAATGMYMTAAAAILRELASVSTSLSDATRLRRDTKMSRRVSPPRGESCLHRGSPRLASELQRPMGSNEVVVAAQQFEVRLERVRRPRMGERPS